MWATVLLVALLVAACGSDDETAQDESDRTSSSTTTTTAPTTTTTEPVEPFPVTVDEYVERWNSLWVIAVAPPSGTPDYRLTTTSRGERLFGTELSPDVSFFLVASSPAEQVENVVVKVTGTSGNLTIPARLLASAGANLYELSGGASQNNIVQSFTDNVVPRLNTISHRETTISLASYFDFHVVARSNSELVFVYTRIGDEVPDLVEDIP
jgi:hypothetical protein